MKEKAFRFLAKFSVFITMWTVMLGAPAANAASVNYIRDVMTRVQTEANADHTITFQVPTELGAGTALTLQFTTSTAGQSNFTFLAGGSSTRDIDISTTTVASLGTDSCASATYAGANTINITSTDDDSTEWSVTTSTIAGGIQFKIDQPNGTDGFAAAMCVRVRIGATSGDASSASYLTNPASTTNTSTQLRLVVTSPSDTGEGGIAIVSDDQLTANATNTPSLTAEFEVRTAGSECDATTTLTQTTLSALAFYDLRADGVVNTRNLLCTRVTSNAVSGVTVQMRSLAGQMSSTRANVSGSEAELVFPAAAQTSAASSTLDNVEYGVLGLNTTTEAYGYCISSAGVNNSGVGTSLASPASATITPGDGVSGTCTYDETDGLILPTAAAPQHMRLLTNALASVWTSSGPVYRTFTNLLLKAAVTVNTPADANYQDTITVVSFATF